MNGHGNQKTNKNIYEWKCSDNTNKGMRNVNLCPNCTNLETKHRNFFLKIMYSIY